MYYSTTIDALFVEMLVGNWGPGHESIYKIDKNGNAELICDVGLTYINSGPGCLMGKYYYILTFSPIVSPAWLHRYDLSDSSGYSEMLNLSSLIHYDGNRMEVFACDPSTNSMVVYNDSSIIGQVKLNDANLTKSTFGGFRLPSRLPPDPHQPFVFGLGSVNQFVGVSRDFITRWTAYVYSTPSGTLLDKVVFPVELYAVQMAIDPSY